MKAKEPPQLSQAIKNLLELSNLTARPNLYSSASGYPRYTAWSVYSLTTAVKVGHMPQGLELEDWIIFIKQLETT